MLSVSLHASAEGLIGIKPYVAATLVYDDNLFRYSDKRMAKVALGTDAMSDTTRRTDAGIDVDCKISLQHLRLELNFNQNRFQRFDFLDNDGNAKRVAWDWSIGSHLGGEVSASESKSMAGFNEIRNPVLNERTTKSRLYSANWDFHPSWRLHLQRDETELINSLPAYRSSDRKDTAHEAAIQYHLADGNMIGLSAREVESTYPSRDRFSTFVFGNGNQQRDLALNMAWQPSGKTSITGRIARIERTYQELSQRDVKAWGGRVGVDWQPTGKTSLSVSAVRDVSGVDDIAATYVQSDTFTVSPTWAATSKLMMQARASYEKRTYQGDPGFLLGATPQRDDKMKTTGLTISYAPHEKIQMQLAWQKEVRNSSTIGNGYSDNLLSANLRINF
jgi:exopolysaccharide biosynthesis operon protein EpsL